MNVLSWLLRFIEHEIHDDHHRRPKDHLFVPEQDLAVMKKPQRQRDGTRHDAVTDHRYFDGGVGPDGKPAEVNQERDDIDLKAAADREKDVEEPNEHQRRADHHAHDAHLMVAGVLGFRWR